MNNDLMEFAKALIQWGFYITLYGVGTMFIGLILLLISKTCFETKFEQAMALIKILIS